MTASDFLATGGGELSLAWFPDGDDASTLLQAWLARAGEESEALPDARMQAFTVAFVYARAYRYLATHHASQPVQESVDNGSYMLSRSSAMAQRLSVQAQRWERKLEAAALGTHAHASRIGTFERYA